MWVSLDICELRVRLDVDFEVRVEKRRRISSLHGTSTRLSTRRLALIKSLDPS